MTKSEFKKLYSFYRKAGHEFTEQLHTSNWPCGYDDMMCERFDDHRNEWLDKNPIIKAIIDQYDSTDYLYDRSQMSGFCLKDVMKYRRAS